MVDLLAETKLFRVGLYFAALIASLLFVLWKIIEVTKSAERVCKKLFILPVVAFLSLAITWKEIFAFVSQLSKNYPDLMTALKREEVIVEAYRLVTDSPEGYWWSSQLLMFTLVYIIFINTKARQISMPFPELCAYICLGFAGAISASFALFLYRYQVTISMETKRVEHHQMSRWSIAVLAVSLWLGFVCMLFLYYSVGHAFKVYLLLAHLLLFLPCLLPSIQVHSYTTTAAKGLIPLLYFILFITLAGHHFFFTHLALPNADPQTFHNLLHAGFARPCQCSISSDAVVCFILSILYLFLKAECCGSAVLVAVPFILLSPCFSLGSTFALAMLYEEYMLERKLGIKEE